MSWKNLFTLGNYSKLQDEKQEFEMLAEEFSYWQKEFISLSQHRLNAYNFLRHERREVHRNLALVKNLIGRVREITKHNEQTVKSDFLSYYKNNSTEFKLGNVSVDFKGKLDAVSENFMVSIDSSFKRLGNKKEFTKADLKNEIAIVAVESLFKGIDQVLELNSEVNEKRRQIGQKRIEVKNALSKIYLMGPEYYKETNGMLEIAKVLNMHNKVFSLKYQEVQKEINKKSKFLLFWEEIRGVKVIPSEKMEEDIHLLRIFASEYNRFNNDSNL